MKSVEERLKSYQPLWENWRYTGEFLGKGGMSSVYEIEHNAYGSRDVCALKIIEVKTGSDGKVRIPTDILNEIKIMRTLSDCVNVVRYFDDTMREVFDDAGNLAGVDILIRMEKLHALNERTKLTEAEVVKLAKDICNALAYVGKKNIIHRDIKPHNIFVDDSGKYKLGDFGISKIVSEYSVNYTMEIGTQAYVAPEMFSGKPGETYGASTDIYSLGLVLYALLNDNKLPFEEPGTNMGAAIHKRLNGDRFPEPAHGKKKLKEIVMKACSHNSADRYHDADEMLKDLALLDKPKHEKYIADPYITIAANDDDSDEGIVYYNPVKKGESGVVRERSIESAVGEAPVKEKKRGGLKISNSFKKELKKDVEVPVEVPTPAPTETIVTPRVESRPTGGGLKLSSSFASGKGEETAETKTRTAPHEGIASESPAPTHIASEKVNKMFKKDRKL